MDKSLVLFIGCFLMVVLIQSTAPPKAFSQQNRKVDNTAFQRGESFRFRASYQSFLTGNVTAGEASLEIKPEHVTVEGQPALHIVGTAHTLGFFNFFFKVENRYESFMDEETVAPVRFIKRVREGKHRRTREQFYHHNDSIVVSDTGTHPIPPYVQDILSVFYYARTFDTDDASPGDAFSIDFFHKDTVYVSRIVYEGKEEITTPLGTFKTLRFKPQVLEGAVFSQSYPMTLWVSDDRNKMPIRVESGLVVGRARLDLISFGGLRNLIESYVPGPGKR